MFLLFSLPAYAGLGSAIIGGAVAGGIAADGARQAGQKVANALNQNKKCLIVVQTTDATKAAIDYNSIRHIDAYTNNYCKGPWWNPTCQTVVVGYDICYTDADGSDAWIHVSNTPEQIVKMGQICG